MAENHKVNIVAFYEIEEDPDWCQVMIDFLEHGKLPSDQRKRVDVM